MSLEFRGLPEKLANARLQLKGEVYAQHGDDDFDGGSDEFRRIRDSGEFTEVDISFEDDVEYATPREFKIIIHNDHYTAMDFVVKVLTTVFHKSTQEAEALMLIVHKKGQAVVGTYAREVAESKIRDVEKMAKEKHYPLRLSMEEN